MQDKDLSNRLSEVMRDLLFLKKQVGEIHESLFEVAPDGKQPLSGRLGIMERRQNELDKRVWVIVLIFGISDLVKWVALLLMVVL